MKKFLIGVILLPALAGCAGSDYPSMYFGEMAPAEQKSYLAQQVTKCAAVNPAKEQVTACVNQAIAAHDKTAEVVKRDRSEALKENVEDKIEAGDTITEEYRHLNEQKVTCAPESAASQTIICR